MQMKLRLWPNGCSDGQGPPPAGSPLVTRVSPSHACNLWARPGHICVAAVFWDFGILKFFPRAAQ